MFSGKTLALEVDFHRDFVRKEKCPGKEGKRERASDNTKKEKGGRERPGKTKTGKEDVDPNRE